MKNEVASLMNNEYEIWLDNGAEVAFRQSGDEVVLQTVPYTYGRSLVVRVVKLILET